MQFAQEMGDKIRDSLLNKLFNINIALSAFFIAAFAFSNVIKEQTFLIGLPFLNLLLIAIYELFIFHITGEVYHKLKERKRYDMNYISKINKTGNYLIFISICITAFLIFYIGFISFIGLEKV